MSKIPVQIQYVGKNPTKVQKVIGDPKEVVKPKDKFWVDGDTAKNLLGAYGDLFKAVGASKIQTESEKTARKALEDQRKLKKEEAAKLDEGEEEAEEAKLEDKEGDEGEEVEVPLSELKRENLDKLAITYGLDPSEYSNKDVLVKAIEEEQARVAKNEENREDKDDDVEEGTEEGKDK